MTNLRKAIFYVQQSLRHDHNDDTDLLNILDLLCEIDKSQKLNGEDLKRDEKLLCPRCGSKKESIDDKVCMYCVTGYHEAN